MTYFCTVNVKSINRYKKRTWVYPNVESAKLPVLHNDDLPISVFSVSATVNCDDVEMWQGLDNQASSSESEFEESSSTKHGFFSRRAQWLIVLNLSKKK